MTFPVIPTAANPGITVSGALLVTDISPGEILTHTITVTLGAADPPTNVIIRVGGVGQTPDGTYTILNDDADNSRYSARQFLSIDRDILHLEPGIPSDIIVTVRIPDDVGDGGRYAIVNIQTEPTKEGGIGVISAFNIPVYLTIKNSRVTNQGKITAISTNVIIPGKPIDIFTSFQNTGNHHFKIKGEVKISDSAGKFLDTIYTALTPISVLPDMVRQCQATFIPGVELPPGIYSINSKVMLEDGIILDEASSSFEVDSPYIPPLSPAIQTILPNEPGVLAMNDGSITISFPQGAVTERVTVTLREQPLEQLPPLPAEYIPLNTSFRIEGITGLLTSEAMLSVKYTATDIKNAGGNVARLKLARWDEATKEWAILKTRVDKTKMTLSTTTNHFSIWTVVVGPETSSKLPAVIGALVAGTVPISLLIILVVKRKDRRIA